VWIILILKRSGSVPNMQVIAGIWQQNAKKYTKILAILS